MRAPQQTQKPKRKNEIKSNQITEMLHAPNFNGHGKMHKHIQKWYS